MIFREPRTSPLVRLLRAGAVLLALTLLVCCLQRIGERSQALIEARLCAIDAAARGDSPEPCRARLPDPR